MSAPEASDSRHKRGRSSTGTAASAALKGHGGKKTRLNARADVKPTLSMAEIVKRMELKLEEYLGVPAHDTVHLWFIQQLLEPIVDFASEMLHEAAWWFGRDMATALGNKEHARYGIFIDVSRDLYFILKEQQDSIEDFETTLHEFQYRYQDEISRSKKNRESLRKNKLRAYLASAKQRDKAKEAGLSVVGDSGIPLDEVLFLDVATGRPIPHARLFAHLPADGTARNPESIPEPAESKEFKGFVEAKDLKELKFRIYDRGTIYWFAKAKDGFFHFVLGASWRNHEDMSPVGHDHVDTLVRFADHAVQHAYKVDKNEAQNMGGVKKGDINMAGWHSSMSAEHSVLTYAPRPGILHGDRADGYIRMNKSLMDVSNALVWAVSKQFAPNVADYTSSSLSRLGFPMLGSLGTDFENHVPSLGSSLSLSRHDKNGDNFANGMHRDRDIDRHRLHNNIAYTTGAWWFGKNGKAVRDIETIRPAFDPAYLIFPKYRIAWDLNSHTFLTGLWRGGLDSHGTTPSTVKLEYGITRWGCSAQSNWGLATRLASENRPRQHSAGNLPGPIRMGPFEQLEKRWREQEEKRVQREEERLFNGKTRRRGKAGWFHEI